MTPAAHIAAAIEVLDDIRSGSSAEVALTAWGRRSRFAGSKDRAAIRDHVFDALRCQRSFAALGGASTGRGLMIGALRAAGLDLAEFFSGEGHAPAPLSADELATPPALSRPESLDCPDWLLPLFDAALGSERAEQALAAMQKRGPVFLRVNSRRTSVGQARDLLARDGVQTEVVATVAGALRVTDNPRRLPATAAFTDGLVDVQDASSQSAVAALPLVADARVLDYCAGGGGKALALADRGATVIAHDIEPRRMTDIAPRAERAGVQIALVNGRSEIDGTFDLVLCDAPCSGSGTWRRTPEAKWALTAEALATYHRLQSEVLDAAAPFVGAGGVLAYATCSVLLEENEQSVTGFLSRHPDFTLQSDTRWDPSEAGDGFYLAILRKAGEAAPRH